MHLYYIIIIITYYIPSQHYVIVIYRSRDHYIISLKTFSVIPRRNFSY